MTSLLSIALIVGHMPMSWGASSSGESCYSKAASDAYQLKSGADSAAAAPGAAAVQSTAKSNTDSCSQGGGVQGAAAGGASAAVPYQDCVTKLDELKQRTESTCPTQDANNPAAKQAWEKAYSEVQQYCSSSASDLSRQAGQNSAQGGNQSSLMCTLKEALPWILGGAALGALAGMLMGDDNKNNNNEEEDEDEEPAPGGEEDEEEDNNNNTNGNENTNDNNNVDVLIDTPYVDTTITDDAVAQSEEPEEVTAVVTGTDATPGVNEDLGAVGQDGDTSADDTADGNDDNTNDDEGSGEASGSGADGRDVASSNNNSDVVNNNNNGAPGFTTSLAAPAGNSGGACFYTRKASCSVSTVTNDQTADSYCSAHACQASSDSNACAIDTAFSSCCQMTCP